MNTLLHTSNGDDFYEVSFFGTIINRISRYRDGSASRVDVDFDDLPTGVQDEIIEQISEHLSRNAKA